MQSSLIILLHEKSVRFIKAYSTLALALFITLLLSFAGIATTIEQTGKTIRNAVLNKQASQDVVIVEMDSRSLKEIGQWPWPRQTHAKLIDQLSKYKASQIAFDVDFSSRSTPDADKALAGAINASLSTVILATFKQRESDNSELLIENIPLPIFSENALLGSVNVIPDQWGVRRHII